VSICLNDFGVVCAIGQNKKAVFDALLSGSNESLVLNSALPIEQAQYVGQVTLPDNDVLNGISIRNNKLAYLAYQQIEPTLTPLIARYGHERVAVVIGTSTAGTYEGELARKELASTGEYPKSFHYEIQEMVAPANFIASLCQATGPVYSISTACSSSGKAFVSGKALLESGLVDVVVVGGVDSLTHLTVNGFESLASISQQKCQPFSKDRDGINIGEAAALFVMTKENSGIQMLGAGETSDAFHMSAPEPNGEGAFLAMKLALDNAGLKGTQVDYVNLHGTGTIKNDDMEAKAMHKACGESVLCGSTKGLTGHTLGAAGALEIGICWLLLSKYNPKNFIPANISDQEIDDTLPTLKFSSGVYVDSVNTCMSNSFAFGGNNFSMVLGKADE
jgi:3-oxoacyl-[acyl-carrier-protein] synthase-1